MINTFHATGAHVPTIHIDFEVFKQITARRATEQVSENDVLRELLGLPSSAHRDASNERAAWSTGGVSFPVGTLFRGSLKGTQYEGTVVESGLEMNGEIYGSPSAAAVAIADYAVNGWRFWECRFPESTSWQSIDVLRKTK